MAGGLVNNLQMETLKNKINIVQKEEDYHVNYGKCSCIL